MNYTFTDLSSSLLASIAFAFWLLPPAFLFAHGTNLLQFRERSWPERLLWVLGLSLPLSLFLSAVVGRWLPPRLLSALFALAALAAISLVGPPLWRNRFAFAQDLRALRSVLFAMLGFAAYVLIMTCGVEIHGRLYESVNYTDWSVRLPLVSGAIRNGVPPGNPFFTLNLQPQAARYYYYWYVLCAQVGRPLHLSARACLTASAVWSGFALVAVLFLYVKHTLRFQSASPRRYLFPLLLCCVMGIDLIPAIAGYLLHPPIIFPEMEWWLEDRIPSFLGAVLFAPHHIGGLVCCAFAFLVLFLARNQQNTSAANPVSRWKVGAVPALTAGICFAACAGDSTYIALCFLVAGVFYAVDLARQGRWGDLSTLCLAGLFALAVSVPFLREITAPAMGPASAHHGFFKFMLRNANESKHFGGFLLMNTKGLVRYRLSIVLGLVLLPLQFGFFLIPLAVQARRDLLRLRAGQSLSDGERLLWFIFLGAALPGFFLSSEPQGVNDLGRHAGLALRLILIVWTTRWLWPYAERLRRREALSPAHPWFARFAAAVFVLGLVTQFWQITSDRLLMPFLAKKDTLYAQPPVAFDDNLGARFLQIRQGLDLVSRQLPPKAVIQSNMGNRFQMLVMLYSSHPFAAGDLSCESAFGGDNRRCTPQVTQLQQLFGAAPDLNLELRFPYRDKPLANAAATTTVANFEQTCRDQNLAAILVQRSDLVWDLPNSWVWRLQPLYAASKVRIYGCPGYFPRTQTGLASTMASAAHTTALGHGPNDPLAGSRR